MLGWRKSWQNSPSKLVEHDDLTIEIGGTLGLKIQKLWNNMDLPFTLQKMVIYPAVFFKHGRTMVEW